MLAMWEPRHAAVVARAGCVPPLVAVVRESAHAGNREFAAALLASLSRSRDIQVEIVSAGGIPALIRLLDEGSPDAKAQAAEALLQLATHEPVRCRLMARGGAVGALAGVLGDAKRTAAGALWSARLLRVLSEVRGRGLGRLVGVWVCGLAVGWIVGVATCLHTSSLWKRKEALHHLTRAPQIQPPPNLQEPTTAQELASCPEVLAACAALLRAPPSYSRSGMTEQDRSAAAWRASKGLDGTRSYFKWADYHGYPGMWTDGGEGGGPAAGSSGSSGGAPHPESAPAVPEPTTKAQAHVAWMLGRLAVATRGSARDGVRALGVSAGVVPALVVMLREAQRHQGVGFNLGTVLQGVQHNSQAAAAFALQALCAGHEPNRRAALEALALQVWLGHDAAVDLSPAGLDTELADLQAGLVDEDEGEDEGREGEDWSFPKDKY